jgi:HPt (histidine-containing phosphotransfer) domain-containing protein
MDNTINEHIFPKHEMAIGHPSMDFIPEYLNVGHLLQVSANNNEFVLNILTTFKEESREFIVSIKGHLSQKDFYSLKRVAHAMKPTGSYIGVEALTTLVTALEKAAPSGDATEVSALILQIEDLITKLLREIDRYLETIQL